MDLIFESVSSSRQDFRPPPSGGNDDAAEDSLLSRTAAIVAAEHKRTGRPETVVDVLHGRALQHYERGLREYLTLRLRSVAKAEAAWSQLRAMVAVRSSESLVAAPGIRAHLYRLARDTVASRERSDEEAPFKDTCIRFERLRRDLLDEEAEILELRYARELQASELALVLDLDLDGVLVKLGAASEKASALLAATRNQGLRRMLLQAFSVRLSDATDEALEKDSALGTGAFIGKRYRVQTRVGSGAFGDVYRAEDAEVPGHVVALKLLHQPSYTDAARQHALRELRHIASVFHPSVVQFKDHGWHEGRLWFVMPWYDGETLASRMEREPLSRHEAHQIFVKLARALEAMHAGGIRHQDIKPDNVFLADLPGEGEVLPVLIDLGVSATEAEMLVAGTPTYFAPEVAAQFATVADKPWVSTKADIFALALTLRNALEPSTEEDVDGGAIETFVEQRARRIPRLPEERHLRFLAPHFKRWMSLDALERPSAEELVRELDVLIEPEAKKNRRRRLLRLMLPVLLVASAAFGGAIVHYEAQVNASGRALSAARSDLAATSAERSAIASRYESMQLSSSELRERLADAESRLSQLTTNHQAQRARNERLSARANQLGGTLERSREARRSERAALERELSELRESSAASLANSERRLAESSARANETLGRLQAQEASAAELRRELVAFERQVASAEAEAAAEQSRAAALARSLEVQIAARRHAEDQVVAARASASALAPAAAQPENTASAEDATATSTGPAPVL
ncbi:MAG: serine/threonine protein kinase [Polyangiales bacterium]